MSARSFARAVARDRRTVVLLVAALALGFVLSGLTPFGGFAVPSSRSAGALPAHAAAAPRSGIADRAPALPHATAPARPVVAERTDGVPVTGHGSPGFGGAGASPPPPSPPSSGRGTFFVSTTIPQPVNATPQFFGSPINDTTSPSIAVSSSGDAVLAYTAFTNASPCANSTPFALTEVGLVLSSNNGTSWSTPRYVGNPDCTLALNYTSAWQPTVAVLANGTFALAYIEYNSSFAQYCPACLPESVYPGNFYFDRLVISYSYTSGATWTAPVAINSSANSFLNFTSSLPELPQLAATGQTLYLLWENYTNPSFCCGNSVGLNMVVSTDGGTTWSNLSAPIQFPVETGSYFSEHWWVDNNPSVLIASNGELFVAYTTNYSLALPPNCQPYACSSYYWDTLNVVVASSTNNGSTLKVHTVDQHLPWEEFYPGDSFVNVAPQLAQDPVTGDLVVAFEGLAFTSSCYTIAIYAGSCYVDAPAPWLSSSSNLGHTWSVPKLISFQLDDPYGGSYNVNTNLGIGFNSSGVLFVTDLFDNGSACATSLVYGSTCGLTSEVALLSTDQGGNFTGPFLVNTGGTFGNEYWTGLTTAFVTLGGNLTFAWADPSCPHWSSLGWCYWAGGNSWVNLTLTQLFTGTGVTVSLNETGLPNAINWTAQLSGNARSGPTGTNLTVSGVPAGPNETWGANWVNTTYGHAFGVTASPPSPGAITASTTIAFTYDPYVLLHLMTVPPGQSGRPFSCPVAAFSFAEFCANEAVNPTPGAHWEPLGMLLNYNVTHVNFSYFCDYCYNYSFLSWTGSGAGSWNTTNPNGTTVLYGPVNETANFNFLSSCSAFFGSPPYCTNATYDYVFQETGLPANTTWEVSLSNQTARGNTSTLAFSAGQGPYNFTIWTVPFNATLSWVGTPTYASPITSLQGATETVRFLLVPDSSLTSGVTFGARGLPAGVASWSLELNGTSYGVPVSNSTFLLTSGSYTVNATDVYGANGVGAYLVDFVAQPLALNATPTTVLPGGTLRISGPTLVTAVFGPEYFVTVSWTAGGTVAPATVGWKHSGVATNLTASPSAGFAFVGWTGTGPGSVTGTAVTISVAPGGPVTELATFAPVVPTFTLQVSASGVRAGVAVTLTVGSQTYTEPAPFAVSGLVAGAYGISVPTVYPNGTVGVRYTLTSLSSSLGLSGGSLDVNANGTLSLGYAVSYALTITPSVNGTTSPGPGTYWELGSAPVALSATPSAGHSFSNWVGLGPGSFSGPNASLALTMTGPVSESAYFSTNPYVPPATYSVTVTESGLPSGVTWSASVGANGASGPAGATASSLVLTGLNGSYVLSVPILPGSTGIRYFPTYDANFSATSANANVSVAFVTQYAITVASSSGGTASASVVWAVAGSTVTLSATPDASSTFENWLGSGAGSYTGTSASPSLTISGPVHELATFVPTSSLHASGGGSSGGSWLLPIGLLVVLLVVGLLVGLVLGRSRPPTGRGTSESGEPEADTTTVPVWSENADTTENPPPTEAGSGDGTDGDSIYGGGSG